MFRLRRPRSLLRPRFGPLMPPRMGHPSHPPRPPHQRIAAEVEALLNSANPADRLHAIDLLALRPHHPRVQAALNQLAELDPQPTVREAARAVLQRNAVKPATRACPACHAVDITGATCPYCASSRPEQA